MKNSNDTIGNRICDLPTCSAVLQPTALLHTPVVVVVVVVLVVVVVVVEVIIIINFIPMHKQAPCR